MNTTIQIRTKSTGLWFVANEGFTSTKRDTATPYDDTPAIRAAFKAQYAGELEFVGSNSYADGAASLPTPPLSQAEIAADLAEKRGWLPFPRVS